MARTPRTDAYLRGFSDARRLAAALVDRDAGITQTRKALADEIRGLKPRTDADASKKEQSQ